MTRQAGVALMLVEQAGGSRSVVQSIFCAERTIFPALPPEDRGGVTLDLVKQVVDSP